MAAPALPRLSSHFGLTDPRLTSIAVPMTVVQNIPSASAVTYTAANLMGGFIIRGASLAAAVTDTLPSAASMVTAVQGCMVNHSIEFAIRNAAAGAYAITVAPGPGVTMYDPAGVNRQIPQNNTKFFWLIFTNVTLGQEAYTIYSMGAATT